MNEIWLGKGDVLIADIYSDDNAWAGVGFFHTENGKAFPIGESDGKIDGEPIAESNPIMLVKSTKPESLEVIIDRLKESLIRMRGIEVNSSPLYDSLCDFTETLDDAVSDDEAKVKGLIIKQCGELLESLGVEYDADRLRLVADEVGR